MLEFILGGAGTGKTSLVYERIQKDIADKRRVILLVPEQETVAREREMTEILPPSAQLHFEVLNFTRLANSFFREHGGLTYHYVTPSVKALAMWNTVRTLSPLLSEYGRQKNDPSFGNMMLSQIEEFKAYSVSPAALERAAEKAETGSRMRAKLSDLALIYSAYTASLDTYGAGDSSDDVGKLAEALSGKNYFKDTRVYIDSFTSFTGAEESVIRHMIKECDRVTAAFTLCDVSCGLQFEGINRAYRRLLRIAERCGTAVTETVLTENHRTKDAALLRLSKDIWRFDAETESKNDSPLNSVSLIKCTNVYEEAEAVSTYVTRLVQSGMRYRDIVILARNTESYSGIIDNALEKAKIPYFMSKKEDITSMPLAKLILCAFRIKNGGYRLEDVISYIKTGLCGIEDRMADLFEQYIWKWNINGLAYLGDDFTMDPDSYSSDPDEKGTALLSIINEARRAVIKPLAELFGKIDTSETNADICRALFEYMEKLHIYEQMKKFASDSLLRGETAEADSAARLYNSILDALSTLAEFDCGEKRYDSDEFETALRIVLSETSLGNIPTSCDEVTFGSASLFRASSPRCVILIGVNDGVFPANTEKARVLGDEDKQ
ncbi:MAG: 3'-5' exonuclease, partial [Clostridia bacterium]|nr:3'-5' exonuclease [Clostridia bacterium]